MHFFKITIILQFKVIKINLLNYLKKHQNNENKNLKVFP